MAPGFPEGLAHVEASYRSVQGTIMSNWTHTEESLSWNITIPPNTSAEVHLPCSDPGCVAESGNALKKTEGLLSHRREGEKTVVEIGSGTYHFMIKY